MGTRKRYSGIPYDQRTIRDAQAMFASIYSARNRLLWDWREICLRIAEQLGELAEAVRTNSPDQSQAIAGIGARIFALANWFEWDLAKLVFAKYSGACPYCHQNPCQCPGGATQKRIVTPNASLLKQTLEETRQMFDHIYGERNRADGRDAVFKHLAEELGELIHALRHRDIPNAQEEIADLFAWWIAYLNFSNHDSLSNLLFSAFPDACSRCGQNPCSINGPCPSF